jgi:hypothetical protein
MRLLAVEVLVLMMACSRSEPTTSVSPAAPIAAGPTAVRSIAASNECIVAPSRFAFHALIPVHYSKYGDRGARDSRQLYTVTCELEQRTCTGALLELDNVDQGKPITFFDFGMVSEAELADRTGDVFTVKWGPYRTFTVDFPQKAVRFVESSHNTEGRGEVACKTNK